MPAIRTFVAIETPPPVQKVIAAVQRRFQPLDLKASWVRSENVHLTLKFLGNIDPDQVPEISRVLSQVADKYSRFSLTLSGLGLFPKKGNPRVLWVGLRDSGPSLEPLHEGIESGLEGLGFDREKRPFSPHLTLARIKSPKNGQLLRQRVEADRGVGNVAFDVNQLVFFQSELTPTGSRYSVLKEIPLGNHGFESIKNSKTKGESNGR